MNRSFKDNFLKRFKKYNNNDGFICVWNKDINFKNNDNKVQLDFQQLRNI